MNGWIVYREPLLAVTVEPRLDGNSVAFGRMIEQTAEEDALMSYGLNIKTEQVIVGSRDPMHLLSLLDRLQRENDLALNIGMPQVQYRETITQRIVEDYTHKELVRSAGQFARVKLRFEPTYGIGYEFVDALADSHPLKRYVDIVAEMIEGIRLDGVIAGYPLTDLCISLINGACHETDTSPTTIRQAVRQCCMNALAKAKPVLLEPTMTVQITVDDPFTGDLLGALNAGRVAVEEFSSHDGQVTFQGRGPLASLLNYMVPSAASPSWPGLSVTLAFSGFAPAPQMPPDDGPFAGAMALREGARLA